MARVLPPLAGDSRALRRDRNVADVLWHFIALLHRRSVGNRRVPPLDVGVLVEIDGLPFVARYPRPDSNIGNGVTIGDELAVREPAVEYAVEPVRLLEKTFLRIGRLALVVLHEMVDLAEHGPGPAHLPHQPLEHAIAGLARFRQQLSRLVGQVDHDRRRFHETDTSIAVDDGGDAIVRADL